MLMGDGLAVDLYMQEVDEELGALVLKPPQLAANGARVHAEFLDHLPARRVREGFAIQHLAAGELPQPAVALALGALAEQEPLAVPGDGGDDVDHGDQFAWVAVNGDEDSKSCPCLVIRARVLLLTAPWCLCRIRHAALRRTSCTWQGPRRFDSGLSLRTLALVKETRYFQYTRRRPDRREILDDWIEAAINTPIAEQVRSDGQLRRWVYIESVGKYLRVILMPDGETVHNAFFDRGFTP
jgi:hypothetical protein